MTKLVLRAREGLGRLFFLFQIVIPSAVCDLKAVLIKFKDAGRDFAQEVPIVAHDHYRAREILDCIEEDFARLDIEMVGRLIEN